MPPPVRGPGSWRAQKCAAQLLVPARLAPGSTACRSIPYTLAARVPRGTRAYRSRLTRTVRLPNSLSGPRPAPDTEHKGPHPRTLETRRRQLPHLPLIVPFVPTETYFLLVQSRLCPKKKTPKFGKLDDNWRLHQRHRFCFRGPPLTSPRHEGGQEAGCRVSCVETPNKIPLASAKKAAKAGLRRSTRSWKHEKGDQPGSRPSGRGGAARWWCC